MKKTFIIAEAGVNHNGSLEMAKEMVYRAAEAGADAVKFQTFRAEKIISKYAEKAEYQIKTTKYEETQLEMVKKLEMDEKMHEVLVECCTECKIEFLSTPFDLESVDLLAKKIRVHQIKIPSGEITNAPLLLKAAQTDLPILLSTGMSTLGDIEEALGVLAYGYLNRDQLPSREKFQNAYFCDEGRELLQKKVTLLHCTTEYPAPFEEVNLRVLETLEKAFRLPVGLSDHTDGITIPIAAVACGAKVIEKHFTLDRTLPGPDHRASIEPNELKQMVNSLRLVEKALGCSNKLPASSELKNRQIVRKSIVAIKPIKIGELFTKENISAKRPGNGISPMQYWDLLGTPASRDYEEDEVIRP
ncbi:N-acetylneuraminate synthase [Brevibacillus sp. AY1]|uniref:N-acetylneuraminate synthase n=1 Tax=Brevibacillus sp. AY1 TaxID=2807621 RepID=UPI002453B311|nr:N-acetylneuraminate synthase [Brevibacillus sp. AY1]MDH4618262.1 N-acetylneuraminate synthase [Brevibacillus sp. AY1]